MDFESWQLGVGAVALIIVLGLTVSVFGGDSGPDSTPSEDNQSINVTNANWCGEYAGDGAATITTPSGDSCLGPSEARKVTMAYSGTSEELSQASEFGSSPCDDVRVLFCDTNGDSNINPSSDIDW